MAVTWTTNGEEHDADAELRRPDVSLRTVAPLLHILRQKHGEQSVNAVVAAAGLDPAAASDTEAWVSLTFLDRLRDEIFSRLYGLNEPPPRDHPLWQMWRQAGVAAFERELIGDVLFVIRALGSPGSVYRRMSRAVRRTNTTLRAYVAKDDPGRVVIAMSPHNPETYREGHERCLGRMGMLEGLPLMWGLRKARVEHTRCMHDPVEPADECEYIVHFQERPVVRIFKTLATAMLVGALAVKCRANIAADLSVGMSLAIGLLLGLGIEGWWCLLSTRRLYSEDREHMRGLIQRADQQYMDLWRDSEELRRLTVDNRNISRYVPLGLLRRLRGQQQAPRLGGSRRTVTVVFVDIQKYSTISEHLKPEDMIRILNECFTAWANDVHKYGGTVLEFLGDGMLAVFGAPGDLPNHACQAVHCVKAIIGSMLTLNDSWDVNGSNHFWRGKGICRLGVRAGVHTGTVVAGNLGSERQMKYAVVGDTVNVAARLEQLNKEMGTLVAVSRDTQVHLTDTLKLWLSPKGWHSVKGRDQPVEVFAHGDVSCQAMSKEENNLKRRRYSLGY